MPEAVIRQSFDSGAVAGVAGRAQRLDGKSAPPSYKIPAKTTVRDRFTIMAWVNPGKYPDGGKGTFDAQSPMTVFDLLKPGTRMLLRLSQKKLQLAFTVDGKWKALNGRALLETGQWRHVAVVRDGADFFLYVDGRLETMERAGADSADWERLTAGGLFNSPDRRFAGAVDELRFYAEALADAGVRRAMRDSGGSPKVTPEAGDAWMSFGKFPALRVVDDGLHPHIDQLSISAMVVSWTGKNANDLVVTANERNLFGARMAVFRQAGADKNNLPVYDEGTTLTGLAGTQFQALDRADGLFDLVGIGEDTPYGRRNLVHYRNLGGPGAPKFGEPAPLKIDGDLVANAIGSSGLCGWSLDDIDGDGVPDLLLAAGERKFPYIPDPGGIFAGREMDNTGPGRGYDIEGNWLGGPIITRLMWAKGARDSRGGLSFANLKNVHHRLPRFAVQWVSTASERAMATIMLEGRLHLICTGNVDRIFALPVTLRDGEVICGAARPLLRDGAAIHGTYIIPHITVRDLDGDGKPELLLDGNPGRVVVLRGDRAGGFEEAGSLQMKGGPLAVDTLPAQTRVDFDGDGLPDLIIGDASGYLTFWPGTGDPMVYGEPVFMTAAGRMIQHQAGMSGSIQGPSERRWGYLKPAVGDWDDDGKPEIITIDSAARVTYYARGGDGNATDLKAPQAFTYRGEPLPAAWRVKPQILGRRINFLQRDKPCLLYLDWDGDLAAAIPSAIGGTEIEESVKLTYADGRAMRMCGPVGAWGRATLAVADWDGDGRWDVLFGTNRVCYRHITSDNPPHRSTPMWLRNAGTNERPVFEQPRLITLKDGTMIDFGVHVAVPDVTDMNGDGRPDLLLGGEDGKIYCFDRDTLRW